MTFAVCFTMVCLTVLVIAVALLNHFTMLKTNNRILEWTFNQVHNAAIRNDEHMQGMLSLFKPKQAKDEFVEPVDYDRRDDETEAMIDKGNYQ